MALYGTNTRRVVCSEGLVSWDFDKTWSRMVSVGWVLCDGYWNVADDYDKKLQRCEGTMGCGVWTEKREVIAGTV
jgi:hypothetical protein